MSNEIEAVAEESPETRQGGDGRRGRPYGGGGGGGSNNHGGAEYDTSGIEMSHTNRTDFKTRA